MHSSRIKTCFILSGAKGTLFLCRILIVLLVLGHLSSAHHQVIKSKPDLPYVKELLDVLRIGLERNNGTGVSAAVIVPEFAPWTGVAGISDKASGEVVKPGMLFLSASIGKNYLAALVLKLAEEGKLSLDDSLKEWITEYPNLDRRITVRQLLNHTSGLPDYVKHPDSPYQTPYASIAFRKLWTPKEIITKLVGKPVSRPGEGWHYSTTNYVLIKMIIERITRSTVEAELKKRFLDPLGLKSTVPLDDPARVPSGFEIAHNWFDANADGVLDDISSYPKTWLSISPDVIFTTAEDLARWSDALFGEQRVLSRKSIGEMLTLHSPIKDPNEPLIVGYGLGTAEFPSQFFGGDRVIGHLGWDFGWMGAMLFFPEHSVSVSVLTNDNNERCITHIAAGLWAVIKKHLASSKEMKRRI